MNNSFIYSTTCQSLFSFGLFQINCALPHRGCQCNVWKKVWNSTCYFTNFSLKSSAKKEGSLDFGCMCLSFLEICVKIRIFVWKSWNSRTIFYQKSLEIQSSLWGRANFLWNNPFQHVQYTIDLDIPWMCT